MFISTYSAFLASASYWPAGMISTYSAFLASVSYWPAGMRRNVTG